MPIPKNPKTIIVKNKYYPTGLTEENVWNYYQRNKSLILREVGSRQLMFAIMVDVNKPVLRKNWEKGKPITLSNSTYDNRITGRTIAIYSLMRGYEDQAIVDIDSDDFKKARECTMDTYDELEKFDMVEDLRIRFTGKTSFHILCTFYRKNPIDRIRSSLQDYLKSTNLEDKYTIEFKRKKNIPNIDLSPNKFNGAYITLHSLSLLGLKCTHISYDALMRFHPNNAKIR